MTRNAEKGSRRGAAVGGDSSARVALAGDEGGGDGRRRTDGAASRARILEAAGKLFASQGFTGTSTRALARAARVNLSAIAYYFGGKDGLYRAVLRQLVADSGPIIMPVVAELHTGVAAAGGDRKRLAEIARAFVHHLLGSVLSDERMRWQMALLLREFHEPSAHFAMLLDERIHPLHNAVAGLVGAATGRAAEAPETRLLTAAVIGQCMALGAARTVICARLGWDGYTPERVEMIIRTITPAVLAMLGLATEDAP